MQTYFIFAAIVTVIVGVVHSMLGEILIFKKLRKRGIVPTESAPPLQARNVKILWATWHLASAFGFGIAGILLSLSNSKLSPDPIVIYPLLFAFIVGSLLVLFATRGKHPGWVGLLVVAVLIYLGGVA
uniref:Uncharacterized protein n=1 Tax=Shewanella sp. (strain MR-7) TaxID=60481 RepID=Q0HZD1_SHESR